MGSEQEFSMLRIINGQKQNQAVRKQHGQLSKWLHYKESLSRISEPMGLKRDRRIEENSAWPEVRPLKFGVKD